MSRVALWALSALAQAPGGPGDPSPRGYRPFIDPLDLHHHWWLTLAPLALGISIAYKAVRVGTLRGFWVRALVMTAQVLAGMVALAACVYAAVEVLVPWFE